MRGARRFTIGGIDAGPRGAYRRGQTLDSLVEQKVGLRAPPRSFGRKSASFALMGAIADSYNGTSVSSD
jgi:hypothetical protein